MVLRGEREESPKPQVDQHAGPKRWQFLATRTSGSEGVAVAQRRVAASSSGLPFCSMIWMKPEADFSGLARFYGSGLGLETSEMVAGTFETNAGFPIRSEANTDDGVLTSSAARLVLRVLCRRSEPKIFNAVIRRIMIDVVDLIAVRDRPVVPAPDKSMHHEHAVVDTDVQI